MTDQTSPVSEGALSVLIKQYALDLRRNASGGDDYPYDFAKGVADYLGVLIKRAKGGCTCAQAGFPDSCDNCDGLAQTPDHQDVRWAVNVLLEKIAEKFEGWETLDLWRSDAAGTVRSFKHTLSDTSTTREGK